MAGNAQADDFNYDTFSRIPIQHEGRIKPMATFALVYLERFYGKSHIGDMSAIAWLAQAMFNPAKAMEQPLFLVKDVEVREILALPSKADNLYNFKELTQAIGDHRTLVEPLLQKPAAELSAEQRTVLELYEDTALFTQLMLSSTLFLPLSLDNTQLTAFIDYYPSMPEMKNKMQAIVDEKGTDIAAYNPSETALAETLQKLAMTMESTQDNALLRVIPPQWAAGDEWLSPWTVFHAGQGSPASAKMMQLWRTLATAYLDHDAKSWQQTSDEISEHMRNVAGVRQSALSLEVYYYKWWPLGITMLLYMAGLIFTLLCLTGLGTLPRVRLLAIGMIVTAALLHGISIAARIYILQRPPVGTLYESLLFVSMIAVLFGLFLEWRQKNTLGVLVAALSGSLLLFASQSFGGDDTMSMLIAVLNTNFWLATHVLCITTGYGFGLVAGIIAHAYLIMRCVHRAPEKLKQVLRGCYGTALIALLFTSLGTILGGIWADQSWGRFWGWDPKENGALLICLWLIWLLHGRISGRFQERGFAVGMALLNVVIALSWLGVNLLATGLHSYGFTDKAALSLGFFCAIEFSFAIFTYLTLWRIDRAALL